MRATSRRQPTAGECMRATVQVLSITTIAGRMSLWYRSRGDGSSIVPGRDKLRTVREDRHRISEEGRGMIRRQRRATVVAWGFVVLGVVSGPSCALPPDPSFGG